MREETFGPVAPLVRCRDIDEAIALADRSEFGLGASIYTNNLEHAMKAMETIHAGTFWINDPLTDNDAGPVRRHAAQRDRARAGQRGHRGLPRQQARPPRLRHRREALLVPVPLRSATGVKAASLRYPGCP